MESASTKNQVYLHGVARSVERPQISQGQDNWRYNPTYPGSGHYIPLANGG